MLGLVAPTDDAWVDLALTDVDALLVDHAHCEMKAASNAMSIAVRHGDRLVLVSAMMALAEEELGHFRRVHDMLVARGKTLGAPPVDEYASLLRKIVGKKATLVERLLIAALIEARSCERFSLLAARSADPTLSAFWNELLAAEAGHYRQFVDLAVSEGARDGISELDVRTRLRELAEREAEVVARVAKQPIRTTIHG